MRLLKTYEEFVASVNEIGFMTLSNNPLGYPNLAAMTDPDKWFTGQNDDPWQWRTRIAEGHSAAYAKLLHGLPSFVSQEWYPLLLAVRRGGGTFEDAWDRGMMSNEARRIYGLFSSRTTLATHEIKQLGGFTGLPKGRYESAMTALQAGMFLTVNGMTRMTTLDGRPYSWPVAEFQRVEDWVWQGTMEQAGKIDRGDAAHQIAEKIQKTLPNAQMQSIIRFINI